ncbi:hypothetical protein OFB83_32095, partial [Escherichia coli]|nr:hypothetical protein [Escherichia coli]
QERIGGILGCSMEVFLAAVCLAQERMPDLPALTDRHLKALIEEAAGLGMLETAYARARERRIAAEREVDRLTAAHDLADRRARDKH